MGAIPILIALALIAFFATRGNGGPLKVGDKVHFRDDSPYVGNPFDYTITRLDAIGSDEQAALSAPPGGGANLVDIPTEWLERV